MMVSCDDASDKNGPIAPEINAPKKTTATTTISYTATTEVEEDDTFMPYAVPDVSGNTAAGLGPNHTVTYSQNVSLTQTDGITTSMTITFAPLTGAADSLLALGRPSSIVYDGSTVRMYNRNGVLIPGNPYLPQSLSLNPAGDVQQQSVSSKRCSKPANIFVEPKDLLTTAREQFDAVEKVAGNEWKFTIDRPFGKIELAYDDRLKTITSEKVYRDGELFLQKSYEFAESQGRKHRSKTKVTKTQKLPGGKQRTRTYTETVSNVSITNN
ncbi:MAG TPA: hypothetical protein PK754_02915 [bacterium]|nr:hypothetical protein [bacterium]